MILTNGRRLTEGEKWVLMSEGRCFDCGSDEPRHTAGELDREGKPKCPNSKPGRGKAKAAAK